MSTYGDGTRRLPFLTVSVLDSYSDDDGYGRVRSVQVETLFGTFTTDEFQAKFFFRNLWRHLRGRYPGGWKYFRPVNYQRPDLGYAMSGNAEAIRRQMQRNKEQVRIFNSFQKLSDEDKKKHLHQHSVDAVSRARESYARILKDIGQPENAKIIAEGGHTDRVGPDEIAQLARGAHERYEQWITGTKP